LTLQLARNTDGFALTGSVHVQGQQISAGHADKNVFYLVDTVLKKLEQEIAGK
jgi:ribosome-associated translation inhibitor RaiA